MTKGTNIKIIWPLTLIALGAAGFFAGIKYNQTKSPVRNFLPGQMSGERGAGGGQNRTGVNRAGQFINGEIVIKDNESITIKLPNNNSQIVYFSPSTTISKMGAASLSDLNVGTSIMVTGNSDSANIITAQSIQIRPKTTPLPMGR